MECNAGRRPITAYGRERFVSLNWTFKDDGNNEWADFAVGHFKVSVMDQDGDASEWSLKYRDVYLVCFERQDDEGMKYHFDIAQEKAERAFRIAFEQKELLRQLDKFAAALEADALPPEKGSA